MPKSSELLKKWRIPQSKYKKGQPPFGVYDVARYLLSGDGYVLVEFGDELNIIVNCKCIAFNEEIKKAQVDGILETCVGQLSVLIHYDNTLIQFDELMGKLKDLENRIPPIEKMVLPSRVIEVPVVFHDKWTRECAEDYGNKIKPIGDNCEIVIKYNGLSDLDELIEYVCAPQHWTANMGWMPGNANCFSLDPRYELRAPKYNPARTWTHPGTLGHGTADKVIYPLNSAGGYQMLGRSPIKMYDPKQLNPVFKDNPVLPRVGDRQKFYPITEDEFYEIKKEIDDNYRYRVHPYELFSVKEYLNFLGDVKEDAEKERKKRPWAVK